MSDSSPQRAAPISWHRPERFAPVAAGVWLGGAAVRALGGGGAGATFLLLAAGGAAALAAGRALPRLREASPALLFLPLTLLPAIPGWRTLAATGALFAVAVAVDRRLDLDEARTARRIAAAALGAAAVGGTALGLLRIRWLADVQYGQDTAYAANLLWNTLHGDFLRSGLLQDLLHHPALRNDFGAHASPWQLLLVPAYYLAPTPLLLVLLRGAALAAAPWILFRHLEREAGPRIALWGSLALALQSTILWQSASAFYFVQLCLPLLVLLAVAWERGALRTSVVTLALLLGFREDLAVIAVGLAGVALLQRRRWPWVVLPAVLGLGWWLLATRVILPAGGAGEGGAVAAALQDVGGSPAGIATRALRDPASVLRAVAGADDRALFVEAASSVGWVGLATPAVVVALPFAAINALIDFTPAKETFMHYHLLPAPFLVLAGLALLRRRARDRRAGAALALGFACALAASNAQLLPLAQTARALRPSNAALRRAALEAIGDAGAVAAPGAWLASLADRPRLYLGTRLWEYPDPRPEVVLWDPDPFRANPMPADRARYRDWPGQAVARGEYVVEAEIGEGVRILRRRADGPDGP